MPTFELIRSEVLLAGRTFKVRRDYLRTPDGRETNFDLVEHGGSVIMLPLDAQGNLLFVRQYRPATQRDLLELPAGTRNADEPYEVCAARELREETGMAAGKLQQIAQFYLAPGYSTELMVVYLATGLRPDPLEADADEFLQVEKIPVRKAIQMAERGDIPDAKSLAALFMGNGTLSEHS